METSALASSKSDFVEKIRILENENKKIHDEFNIQRAKLKDLFIQKESECVTLKNQLDEIKSQFLIAKCKKDNETLKAQEEISSLQHLVQETIEESTICKIDLEKLLDENNRLKLENQRFKEESIERPELSSLTPVFSQVRKTLTKKLVGEGVEDSIKKIDKYAQEDAEVLRSIVVPLEEEIKALKEKIRSTDDELQLYKNDVQGTNNKTQNYSMLNSENKNISNETLNKSTSMEFSCENCALLQGKIFTLEEVNKNSEKRVQNFEKLLSESKDELIKEAALRKDLEIQWQEKREIHKEEILNISEQLKKSDEALGNVAQKFLETKKQINEELSRLIEDREKVNKRLEMLQRDNDYLSGRFLASSEELENQKINLPNNVQELHEQILRLQSDLLHARIGFEFEKRKNVSYIDENIILRDQLKLITEEREEERLKVQNQIKSLEFRLQEHLTKGKDYEIIKEKTERKELEMSKNMSELRVQILELQGSNDKLKRNNEDLKSKIINLQEDLKTSEHVQKDFVKLSQSLQIALEGIRQAETQVRWQDDDDVEKCPNCFILFTVTCRKQHCRHCGKVFCEKCLTKTVPSGRQKFARVCDICHTVLTPNTAPYFSKEPPHSNL